MSVLTGIALNVGAAALSQILRRMGGQHGELAADVAQTAVTSIATKLGVEPTEDAIAAHFEEDPNTVTEALKSVDADLAAVAQAASDATQSYHQILQADAKSDKLLNRIWRPLNGILFAFSCTALIVCFCKLMWSGDHQTIANAAVAYGFLGTVLGTWAGVVGVYVWRRTDEKKAGTA